MTRLSGITPTPAQLADAWVDEFAPAIARAGGADARISMASAERLAKESGAGRLASDNLVGYLEATGQASVGVDKLLGIVRTYVEREASEAAGANKKLSLVEARLLPADLQADFLYLRGKGLPETKTWADLATEVRSRVLTAFEDWTKTPLATPPWQVRGERPIVENIPHPSDPYTRGIAYVADGRLYVSIARTAMANPSSPAVGWYDLGEAHWDG